MSRKPSSIDGIASVIFLLLLLAGLCLSSLYSYPLFHTLAETFSTVVACCIFILAWNARRFSEAGFLTLIGISSLFVGAIDLAHALAYKGMALFRGYDANLPTQLWIAARYVQSLSFLAAPLFLSRPLRTKRTIAVYFALTSLLLGAIFRGGIFPDCFIEGSGLTPFKKISEYVIAACFIGAAAGFRIRKKHLDPRVLRFLLAASLVTAAAELMFTLYRDVYGLFNLAGHVLKIVSFYLIYKSIIETGIVRPFDLLFRELKENEEAVRRANEELEARVAKRTADLGLANEALQDTLQRLSFNIRRMPLGYIVWDRDFRVTEWNPAAGRIFGWPPEEALGKHPYEFIVPEEARAHVDGVWERLLSGDERSFSLNVNVHKDGSRITCEWFNTPLWDSAGNVVGVLSLVHDVTEKIRLEEDARLRQALLIHANRMASLGTIVSGVAHEINNPNNLVMFNAPLVAAAWADAAAVLEERHRGGGDFVLGGLPYSEMREIVPRLLSGITDASRRIKDIVDNLKDFARQGKREVEMVSVNEAVRAALTLLNHEIMKGTRRFRKDLEDGLPPVRGSGQQIEQVVVNLLTNALQSLPGPERAVQVRTSLRRDKGLVEICVADEGGGMSPEVLKRVSEPFFSTRQDSGGLGLGLSICRSIVKDHGGELVFESEVGRGTTVRVLLPCMALPAKEDPDVPAPSMS